MLKPESAEIVRRNVARSHALLGDPAVLADPERLAAVARTLGAAVQVIEGALGRVLLPVGGTAIDLGAIDAEVA